MLQIQHSGSAWGAACLVAAGTAFLSTGPSLAQAPSATPPLISYVASVKVNNDPDARGFNEYSPGGRFTATAVTLGALLRTAYRIQPYQLLGAPGWISTRRYDIAAKVEDTPAPTQQAFLQALLRDRFKLVVRNETREVPIFALVVARNDGRLGAKLTKSDFDCAAYFAGPRNPPQLGVTPSCVTRIGLGNLYGKAIPMTTLATSLAPFAGRFTVDKTGLAGLFAVELTWTPEPPAANLAGPGAPEPAPVSAGPSLFTALQEQLGLKLVSDKGPVPVLVVDRVEEPAAN